MTSERRLADAVQEFAQGDLEAVEQIRRASRRELDSLASEAAPYRLSKQQLTTVLRALPLDPKSQNNARVWAFFWREGLFPQQVEGESPSFDTEWDDPSLAMNEVMGLFLELGDDDVGWLDESDRQELLQLLVGSK